MTGPTASSESLATVPILGALLLSWFCSSASCQHFFKLLHPQVCDISASLIGCKCSNLSRPSCCFCPQFWTVPLDVAEFSTVETSPPSWVFASAPVLLRSVELVMSLQSTCSSIQLVERLLSFCCLFGGIILSAFGQPFGLLEGNAFLPNLCTFTLPEMNLHQDV